MGSLFNWVGVLCIKVGDSQSLKNLTQRGHGSHSLCYSMASMGQGHLDSLSTIHDPVDPINPPQGSLARLVPGVCQISVYPWYNPIITPFGSWLNWGGAGISVLCMADTHTQGNTSLWCDEKLVLVEDAWLSALVCHFVGEDVCCNLMHHLTYLMFPPILNLLLSLKGVSLH